MQRWHQHQYNFIPYNPLLPHTEPSWRTKSPLTTSPSLLLRLIDKRHTAAMRKSHQAIVGSQGKWGHYLPLPDYTCDLPSILSKGTKTSFGGKPHPRKQESMWQRSMH